MEMDRKERREGKGKVVARKRRRRGGAGGRRVMMETLRHRSGIDDAADDGYLGRWRPEVSRRD
jgi:hypothetical protein